MINRVIWKVLLMLGGIVGSVYSIPKISEYYHSWSYWDGRYEKTDLYDGMERSLCVKELQEIKGDLTLWIVLLIVFVVIFIIGCCISANMNQNDNQHAESNSNEESN